jgi:hypothetical protein
MKEIILVKRPKTNVLKIISSVFCNVGVDLRNKFFIIRVNIRGTLHASS